MKLLEQIKSYGYDVRINKGNIKLSYNGGGVPDKSRVVPLFEELKANKDQVIKELQRGNRISDEILQDLFLETMNRINDKYLAGTINYTNENHKDLDAEINKADDKINEVWKLCNEGAASIEDFRDTLDLYKNLFTEAISLFKSESVNNQEVVSI